MRELQQKQIFRRRLFSIPVLVLLAILTIALSKGAYAILVTERESAKQAKALEEEVLVLTEREEFLKVAIDKLQTDEGVEEEIKSKFNVARLGERVAIIVDPPEGKATTTAKKEVWYKRLWGAIIGANE